jgi:MoaA/NifB/PqqE/SkfB family radical SAM enzyme
MENDLIGACWAVTTCCNMRCPICYSFMESSTPSLRDQLRIVDILADFGLLKISFGGGEPLLNRHICQLIRHAHGRGIKTALCSNGVLVDQCFIKKIEPFLDELTLPLEGSNEKIHGYHRASTIHFYHVMDLLERALEWNVFLDVSTVVTRLNLHDLNNIGRLLIDNGVRKWKLFQFHPIGRGAANNATFGVSDIEFEEAREQVMPFADVIDIDFSLPSKKRMKSYFNISPTGKIFVSEEGQYSVIGDVLNVKDPLTLLTRSGFNLSIHLSRHHGDMLCLYEKEI